MQVVILYGQVIEGANEDEQDALVQAEAISESLRHLGYDPVAVPLSLNLQDAADTLRKIAPAFVFNIVETVMGQGRLIHLGTALLDALRIPYTGARTDAMFLTSNKLLAKQLLPCHDILTPRWFALQDVQTEQSIPNTRYILKAVWEHASIGLAEDSVIIAQHTSELRAALEKQQKKLGGEGFAEMYIEGREFNLSVLAGKDGPEVLPVAEIRFDHFPQDKLKIVDYRAKWFDDSFEYRHTPRTFDLPAEDERLVQKLRQLALQCWHLFRLRGYARVDFRVAQTCKPYVLEVNTNPCLSPDAGFAAAAKQAGLSYDQVIERIIKDI